MSQSRARRFSSTSGRAPGPLHAQLELSLREQVRSGRLAPRGEAAPHRAAAFAAELGVSRGRRARGLRSAPGRGVSRREPGGADQSRRGGGLRARAPWLHACSCSRRQYAYRFDPALPDLAAFPRDRWLRSLRAALRDAQYEALGHADPRGAPELRNALMEYLGRARGAAPDPEHTLVCAGFTQAFGLLCTSLRERGIERIAIEDPGWAQHRLIAEGHGLEPIPIPDGRERAWTSPRSAASGCETCRRDAPAHQFPRPAS